MQNLVKPFREIFDLEFPLAIHKSQRPYVWDIDKVNRLIEDLEDFNTRCENNKLSDLGYYMGTIVLYKNTAGKNQLEIIDGQQRLTTLLLIDYFSNESQSILLTNTGSVIFEFSSSVSAQNIQKVKSYLKQSDVKSRVSRLKQIIQNRLVFTVVEVATEDEAFTYFDTQNNRGKKPSIDVVLKAVHLRGIIDDANLQKQCAEKWENIEKYAFHGVTIPGNSTGFLYPFMKFILWRARTWKFNKSSFESANKIEYEFSRNVSSSESNGINFYPQNIVSEKAEFEYKEGSLIYNPKSINFSELNQSINHPFQLRQPLKKGFSFFLFLEKYALIYRMLFAETKEETSAEINLFKSFYKKVYQQHSQYMKHYYILCIMMFYDKFKDSDLLNFALALDYLIGSERLSNYYIFDVKYLNCNNQNNILDAIQMSYSSKEVISFVVNINGIQNKKIGAVNKIITAYLYEIEHYYKGGPKKTVPHKITEADTKKENEISKVNLLNELNEIVAKRKEWLLNKISA